jgi:hypothetical protein
MYCMKFPGEYWWDKKTAGDSADAKAAKEARSKSAGCGIDNRCSKPPLGDYVECDEFPFDSTDPMQYRMFGQDAINRCVPSAQNEGEYIAAL